MKMEVYDDEMLKDSSRVYMADLCRIDFYAA